MGAQVDIPLIDEEILEGPPCTTWYSFQRPKIRQFPCGEADLRWLAFLGHGLQGAAFKVSFGGKSPVVLKIFWDSHRPKPIMNLPYMPWAFKDECRTVSLLEKMKWAMASADTNLTETITIKCGPRTENDAIRNLRAFSDEYRRGEKVRTTSSGDDYISPPPFPPLPEFYGWTKIASNKIRHLPSWLIPDLHPDDNGDLFGIVYEFIPPQKQDRSVAQVHLDFFYAVGFQVHPYKPDNWHGGRLVGISDVWTVFQRSWNWRAIIPENAQEWMWTLGFTRDAMPENMPIPTVIPTLSPSDPDDDDNDDSSESE